MEATMATGDHKALAEPPVGAGVHRGHVVGLETPPIDLFANNGRRLRTIDDLAQARGSRTCGGQIGNRCIQPRMDSCSRRK